MPDTILGLDALTWTLIGVVITMVGIFIALLIYYLQENSKKKKKVTNKRKKSPDEKNKNQADHIHQEAIGVGPIIQVSDSKGPVIIKVDSSIPKKGQSDSQKRYINQEDNKKQSESEIIEKKIDRINYVVSQIPKDDHYNFVLHPSKDNPIKLNKPSHDYDINDSTIVWSFQNKSPRKMIIYPPECVARKNDGTDIKGSMWIVAISDAIGYQTKTLYTDSHPNKTYIIDSGDILKFHFISNELFDPEKTSIRIGWKYL